MEDPMTTKNQRNGGPERSPSSRASRVVSPKSSPKAHANKRKSGTLPPETVDYLKAWMMSPEHIAHPYPTEQEKAKIMEDTGIELKQLTNWFVNNRKRFWKPRVEARIQEQARAQGGGGTPIKSNFSTASLISLSSLSGESSDSGSATGKRTSTRLSSTSPRRVSEVVSDHGSVSSGTDEDYETTEEIGSDGMVTRTESVDVHILRPVQGGTPTIEDVSILCNVPEERILRSYENCALSFVFADDVSDRKKIASRRDVEIVRMKKHYLKLFLAENDILETPKKRVREEETAVPTTPRPKYRRVSLELWKSACLTTSDSYDEGLPSLEEAAQLFGYACEDKVGLSN